MAEYRYQVRGLPSSIRPDHMLWCISGTYVDDAGQAASGVLEWCYNKRDAERLAAPMSRDTHYSQLRIHPWLT